MKIFLHIPKTGGKSLYPWMRANAARKFAYLDEKNGVRNMVKASKGADVLAGHVPFGVHCRTGLLGDGETARYCTVLRDPVERAISEYWWARGKQNGYPHQADVAGVDLAGYVRGKEFAWSRNMQTRIVAGRGPVWTGDGDSDIDEDIVAIAKCNIRHWFDDVGVTEYLQEFAERLGERWGWDTPGELPWEHWQIDRPSAVTVGAALCDEIRAANALDVELYEWAKGGLDA